MRRLQVLAPIVLASFALPAAASGQLVTGGGALQASASIDMRIVVPRTLELTLLDQPSSVNVTAADAANGEVVVSGPRVALIANGRQGYYIQAELGGPFTEATIEGLARPVSVSAAAIARVLMPTMVGAPKPAPYRVLYRLRLQPGTPPGTYGWPVALSLQSP
ncbi:MAG TPA: hypothetical protein VEG27_14165 [Usitatibacter sp.]|nr:hypothetical protein [Usitatibacter sp.]